MKLNDLQTTCIYDTIYPRKLRTCVQGEGGPGQCVCTAYREEGGGGVKELAKFCVRTLWMAPYLVNQSHIRIYFEF